MPRIDPLQLLKCLSVLLSSEGGIKSRDEVHRLASLMTKFSKKLVSKCIYVQILRTTDMELLGMFMGAGGWNLAHQWLSDAILAQNLPFIKELLELLLMCPVDVERLKANNFPKLIKNLTKEASNESVRLLASQLVDQWLRIVKGLPAVPVAAPSIDIMPAQTNIIVAQSMNEEVLAQESYECSEAVMQCVALSEQCADFSDGLLQEPDQVGELVVPEMESEIVDDDETDSKISEEDGSALDGSVGTLPVYRITIRDGKQVLAKVNSSDRAPRKQTFTNSLLKQDIPSISTSIIPKHSSDSIPRRKVSDDASSTKSKSIKSNIDVKKITKDIQKKLHEKSLTEKKMKLIEPSKEKPSEAMTDKERARERRERELNKLKEKRAEKTTTVAEKMAAQAERDKATLAKLVPPPISKLGKIPKKPRTDDDSNSLEGKRLSSDDKKPSDNKKLPQSSESKKSLSSASDSRKSSSSSRPKTVKSFNSKFRSTGLEEDIKPPSKTSRRSSSSSSSEKKTSKPEMKRTSPVKDGAPPEKKPKVTELPVEEVKKVDKPQSSKPKRLILQESDMFMDALTASTKIEPRKRKRRTSTSKDGIESKKEPGSKDATTPPGSPNSEDNVSPVVIKTAPKFYRDTLELTEEEKEENIKKGLKEQENGLPDPSNEKDSSLPNHDLESSKESDVTKLSIAASDADEKINDSEVSSDITTMSLKGVLVIHKSKKGPKKNVHWKVEQELESIKYFELDETERVNVTKTFTDMKQMERSTEREGFQLSRKLAQEDNMEEKATWKHPVLIDIPPPIVQWGEKSKEKDIQYARESIVLSALYFNRSSIPDSAGEPDVEMHPAKDPTIIPLDDTTGNPEGVVDFRGKPWPEPKPMLPPTSPTANIFQQSAGPFMPFPGSGPGFNNMGPMYPQANMGPGMMVPNNVGAVPMGGDWRTGDGRIIAMDNTASMEMYNQQGGPAMGMGMPGVMGSGPVGPMDINYSMMPNDDMPPFPMQGFPMQGPPMPGGPMFQQFRGPMGPNSMRGNRNNGGPRGQWFRPNGAMNGAWQSQGRGGGRQWPRGVCHQFASRGSCRQGSKCTYSH